MATPFRRHFLAALIAVGCYVLTGCVVAELHFTASPVPPWVQIEVKGLMNAEPPAQAATAPATAPAPQP